MLVLSHFVSHFPITFAIICFLIMDKHLNTERWMGKGENNEEGRTSMVVYLCCVFSLPAFTLVAEKSFIDLLGKKRLVEVVQLTASISSKLGHDYPEDVCNMI